MDLKKEKNDATKKKGMALNDDALKTVTGGGTARVHVKYEDDDGVHETDLTVAEYFSLSNKLRFSGGRIISKKSVWSN